MSPFLLHNRHSKIIWKNSLFSGCFFWKTELRILNFKIQYYTSYYGYTGLCREYRRIRSTCPYAAFKNLTLTIRAEFAKGVKIENEAQNIESREYLLWLPLKFNSVSFGDMTPHRTPSNVYFPFLLFIFTSLGARWGQIYNKSFILLGRITWKPEIKLSKFRTPEMNRKLYFLKIKLIKHSRFETLTLKKLSKTSFIVRA